MFSVTFPVAKVKIAALVAIAALVCIITISVVKKDKVVVPVTFPTPTITKMAETTIIPTQTDSPTPQKTVMPKYTVVYELKNKRYDGGKNYYVLIASVNLTNDKFKDDIKTITRDMVSKHGNKISIEIHDKKSTLDLSYHQYGDMTLNRILTKSELAEVAVHFIADYAGELATGQYLNSIAFFPGSYGENETIDKYAETLEFNASK